MAEDLQSSSQTPISSLQTDNSSPTKSLEGFDNGNSKGRILFCRKCEGHGKQALLKGHAPICPYSFCKCKACDKLHARRMVSFTRRNKDRIEAARALTVQRQAMAAVAAQGAVSPTQISNFSGVHQEAYSLADIHNKFADPIECTTTTTFDQMPQQLAQIQQFAALPLTNCSLATSTNQSTFLSKQASGEPNLMFYDLWLLNCQHKHQQLRLQQQQQQQKTPSLYSSPTSQPSGSKLTSSPMVLPSAAAVTSTSSPCSSSSTTTVKANSTSPSFMILDTEGRRRKRSADEQMCEKRVINHDSEAKRRAHSFSCGWKKVSESKYTPFYNLSRPSQKCSSSSSSSSQTTMSTDSNKDQEDNNNNYKWITLPTIPPIRVRIPQKSQKEESEARTAEKDIPETPKVASSEHFKQFLPLQSTNLVPSGNQQLASQNSNFQQEDFKKPESSNTLSEELFKHLSSSQSENSGSGGNQKFLSQSPNFPVEAPEKAESSNILSEEHLLASLLPQQVTTSQLLFQLQLQQHMSQACAAKPAGVQSDNLGLMQSQLAQLLMLQQQQNNLNLSNSGAQENRGFTGLLNGVNLMGFGILNNGLNSSATILPVVPASSLSLYETIF